jgi:type I restriction enzyme S subunit
MSRIAPFWSLADLVSESANPAAFQVSLEDMMSDTGRLVDDKFSQYDAKGTPFLEGDVLFGKLRPYLAKYWLADRPGTAGGDIHVYRPAPDVDPRFLRYIIGNRDFIKYAEAASKGVKMPRVEWMGLREFGVYRPDLPVQQRIADYLDREVGEIDAMIAKMDELAATLGARKSGTRAVAIAKVKTRRGLRWMSKNIGTGPFGTQVKENDYVEGGTPLINPSHIINGRIRPSVRVRVSTTKAAELSRFNMDEGDIVVARRGEFGRCAVVQIADLPVLCGTGSLWVKLDSKVALPEFVQIALSSTETIRALEQSSVGTTMNNLNERILGEISLPCPPLEEQRRIVDYLDEVTGKIDAMLAKVAELKSLLTERRAALSTDVVTGRKEVA